MSTALWAATKARWPRPSVSYSTFRKAGLVQPPLSGMEGKHEHHRCVPEPFIAIRFPLASLCAGMATFRGHSRRGAVIRLDGDPGLGRVGLDRSDNVKSALPAAFIRQTTKRTAQDLHRSRKLSRRPRHMETNRLACPRSRRCERVGGTGAAAWPRPELRLGDPEMAVLSSRTK